MDKEYLNRIVNILLEGYDESVAFKKIKAVINDWMFCQERVAKDEAGCYE